jgi:hypothetical protein
VRTGAAKEVIEALGIIDVTYYCWRQKYGGMSVLLVSASKSWRRGAEVTCSPVSSGIFSQNAQIVFQDLREFNL